MYNLRHAARSDERVLCALIEESVRVLQGGTYSPAQIDSALATVYGVDTALIDDGTYFVAEDAAMVVACGGWGKRATLYGGDRFAGRTDDLLDPTRDAAKIRAFFVLPTHVRRGIASALLERCEREAFSAGFRHAELGATLTGVPFYLARGYVEIGPATIELADADALCVMRMGRRLS